MDLKNVSIYCNNTEIFINIQKFLLNLDYIWWTGDNQVLEFRIFDADGCYINIDVDNKLSWSYYNNYKICYNYLSFNNEIRKSKLNKINENRRINREFE